MKTIYLIAWIINALLLAIYTHHLDPSLTILHMFNCLIPTVILILRMIIIHSEVKDDLPI
jgi:hypothetical protein